MVKFSNFLKILDTLWALEYEQRFGPKVRFFEDFQINFIKAIFLKLYQNKTKRPFGMKFC